MECRGMCSDRAKRMLKNVIQDNKVNFLCLQETKCASCTSSKIIQIWGNQDCDWVEVQSSDLSGGLLCIWNTSLYKVITVQTGFNWICFQMQSLVVVNVYSPQDLQLKMSLWSQLYKFVRCWNGIGLCNLGDFNCIRNDSERLNCIYRRSDVEDFNHFIHNANSLDLAIENYQYTWYGSTGKQSKLDRVLVNHICWGLGHWSLKALNSKNSDHKPLLFFQRQTD